MLLLGKTAAPESGHVVPYRAVLEQAAREHVALLIAPPGTLIAESLATVLTEVGRKLVWLSAGADDRDPAQLLLSLIAAAQQVAPGVGATTLDLMRRHPGPIRGWATIFAHLAHRLAEALPPGCTLVVEHVELLDDPAPTLGLFVTHILGALPAPRASVLIADYDLPHAALPDHVARYFIADLHLAGGDLDRLAGGAGGLTGTALHRASALLHGRADALFSLCRVTSRLGPRAAEIVERARSGEDLLIGVARAGLQLEEPGARQILDLSLHLPCLHPDLVAALGQPGLPDPMWLTRLHDRWARPRPVWRVLLPRSLREADQAPADLLLHAADYLAQNGATAAAITLLLDLDRPERAAQLMAEALEPLMSLGQWETLRVWLDQLPRAALHSWPWLVYAQGEIAAAARDVDTARRSFAVAGSLFGARRDSEGLCQSLLAESTLALWQGEQALAQSRALSAYSHAESGGLAWQHGWAAWQLVCLSMADGDVDTAMVYLDRALTVAAEAGEQALIELLRMVEELMVQRRDLISQREFHRQAYLACERAERAVIERLRELVVMPPADAEALASTHPWSLTPLLLKLPAPAPTAGLEPGERASLWQSLLRALGLRRTKARQPADAGVPGPPPAPAAWPPEPPVAAALPAPDDICEAGAPLDHAGDLLMREHGAPTNHVVHAPYEAVYARPGLVAELTVAAPEGRSAPALAAHMLGQLRVSLNENPIESWPRGRGRAVLKYLLVHRERPTPRDVLMDLFWPDSGPEDARNSLHVALHGLRQALRTAADVPVVVFSREGTAYSLSPELQIWLDSEEFEQHVQAGRQHEAAGRFGAAAVSYEQAASLYQGDFLEDDPYEEWPMLRREQLRLAYLDTLERLSQIYFSQGQYAACTNLCQLILARDSCREDAHCRLMRCYSRQGQHHMALRQYQACARTLKADLGVEPAPATAQLAERVRRREHV